MKPNPAASMPAIPAGHHVNDALTAAVVGCIALTVALSVYGLVLYLLRRALRKNVTDAPLMRIVLRRLRNPALVITLLTALGIGLQLLDLAPQVTGLLVKLLAIAGFAALGWLMVAGVYLFEEVVLLRYDVSSIDNLKARRVRTQLQLMRRMAIILLLVVDAGLILSLFHESRIWHYGAGLLASAGLASLVLATAAKSTASNLLAGLQIALTEPIRLDDVVIVKGEWGRIEEITTTYVVVAIWDQRRLMVPLTYFIENPFQNWTREHADLLGTSFLYVDYSVPVAPLRQELTRLLENSPLWDRKVNSLQVTNLSENTMELRCLMSARNSSEQFDLRCDVREGMISFLQQNYPDAFPRTRFSAVGGQAQGLPTAQHQTAQR